MRIMVVDPSLDVRDQLKRISEETGISFACLTNTWNEKNETQQLVPKDFVFDLEPAKIDHVEPEKRMSYQAQQKQLPKFLKKR